MSQGQGDTATAGNPFGAPETPAGWEDAARLAVELVDPAFAGADVTQLQADADRVTGASAKRPYGVLARAARDSQQIEATGRWRIHGDVYREPERRVPGDVLGMRALAAAQTAATGEQEEVLQYRDVIAVINPGGQVRVVPAGLQLANLLYAAECYWLPAAAEAAVLGSEPPSGSDLAELVLPHGHSVVWFAQGLDAPPQLPLLPVQLLESWRRDYHGGEPAPAFIGAPLALRGVDPQLPGEAGRLAIDGVVLAADEDGHAHDLVVWVCRVTHGARRQRLLIPGRRSLAGWRTPLHLLTAIVAWGDWMEPPEGVRVGTTRGELRGLRHGRTRRAEEAGGLAAVRVLDTRRPGHVGRPSRAGDGTHASPITHLRRAHFRRVPVGPGGQDREVRWIRPTIVNPGHEAAPTRIYRLPPPPSAAQR